MSMETSMVLDRGKSSAERVAGTFGQLPPVVVKIVRRRKSRSERLAEALQSMPPVARIGLVAAAAGVVAIGLAYVARSRLLAAAAGVGGPVKGAVDAVEGAAENPLEAAQKRSDSSSAG
jgi:hypothetical protein